MGFALLARLGSAKASGPVRRKRLPLAGPAGAGKGARLGVSAGQLFYQCLDDALFDLVPDAADYFDALACRIVEDRVFVALAGEVRAGVAAAHGDGDVGFLHGPGAEDRR